MLFLLLTLSALTVGCSQQRRVDATDVGPVPSLTKDELERTKLAAEIRATEEKAARDTSLSAGLLQWAPFITALVAVLGVGLTLRAQLKDRQEERRKRHDEELARTVQNLGSNNAGLRLNAAAALTAYLGPDSPGLQLDLLTVVIANLRRETDRDVADVLVRDLELGLRECQRTGGDLKELDLARSPWLVRLDLHGIDLTNVPVDLAFANLRRANLSGLVARRMVRGWGADFENARLSDANLLEARLNNSYCRGAAFHDAKLVCATFKDADLRTAQFQRAMLQGVHFERAQLQGAVFTEADVSDAWFCDSRGGNVASLDEAALRTLAKARRWKRAHLAPVHMAAIEVYTGNKNAMPRLAARLVAHGALREAEKWYERSMEEGIPVSSSRMRKLGNALRNSGDAQGAIRWLQNAANGGDAAAATYLAEFTRATTETKRAEEEPPF